MLKTYVAAPVGLGEPFTFTVPGQYAWSLLSVYATCARDDGGTSTRTFTLTLDDGTNNLVASPALDTAPDPGPLAVTWANMLLGSTATATDNVIVVPFPTITCAPGYNLTGQIGNALAGDQWTSAIAWVDETYVR